LFIVGVCSSRVVNSTLDKKILLLFFYYYFKDRGRVKYSVSFFCYNSKTILFYKKHFVYFKNKINIKWLKRYVEQGKIK